MAKRSKVYPVHIPEMPLRPSRAPMSKRMRRRLAFILAGTIVGIVAAAVLLAVFDRPEKLLAVGSIAPDFTLPGQPDGEVVMSTLRGKVVLLEFCATWSSPCAKQAPLLNRIGPSTSLLAVNGDSEDAASVASFRRNHHLRYPILLDPGAKTVSFPARGPRGPATARYHVTRFPTFYVVAADGRVAWRMAGLVPLSVLVREIRRAGRSVP